MTSARRGAWLGVLVGLSLLTAVGRPVATADSLDAILEDHWQFTLREDPVLATRVGVRDYDGRLADYSPAAYERLVVASREFLTRLEALDPEALAPTDRVNWELLKRLNLEAVQSVEVGYRYLDTMTGFSTWYTQLASLPDRVPLLNRADYESYIARLRDVPRYVKDGMALMQAGLDTGFVQSRVALEGSEAAISTHLVDRPEDSVFFQPFSQMPSSIPPETQRRLRAEARDAIRAAGVPAHRQLLQYYEGEYLPRTRTDIGASGLPGGEALYAFGIRRHTTTSMTADEVHELGLSEVSRIREEMDAVILETGFDGDFEVFQEFLRTDSRFYPESEEEYLAQASLIAKRLDGELPRLFGRLPRTPYTIKPVPPAIAHKTTTAYAEPASPDGSIAGVFRLNTSRLSERPLYELEALTAHEAMPGHLLQITLANELDLPMFRRVGFGVTAFVEGWGLYAERLGLDVGFYTDPYANFGRLSYEMWRACRLVVDTGMHALGWSRQRAIDFMLANTSLTPHNIVAEVDRYISWPGQALGYKLGELKFRELRSRAETALGESFDLRAFHDAVLENGAIPLDILEAHIDRWIADRSGS
ncbi:MAG: DUF885 domain-containing protein [Acidobacteriota bacterium]|nr:DUF885 domain-containing protein [Acidobacteriota bacterium]